MKTLKYAFAILLAVSLASCTSSILGEDDPIVKPPPPPPCPTCYNTQANLSAGLNA